MTEQSKLEWTEYKSRFRAVTAYGTYWVDMYEGSTSYKLICGTNPCCVMFHSPQEAKDCAQMIHDSPSSRDDWFNLSDVEQAPYHAPLDLSELLRTYETLLAGDNLPERIAVQTTDLRALLEAAHPFSQTLAREQAYAHATRIAETYINGEYEAQGCAAQMIFDELRLLAKPMPSASIGIYLAKIIDELSVDNFTLRMKRKLAKKRAEGRSGWQNMNGDELSDMLHQLVTKGDPVDVANLCMMLSETEQSIKPASKTVEVAAALNSAALIVEGRCTAVNSDFIQKLSKRNVYEIAALVAEHDIKLGAAIRALSPAEPAQGDRWHDISLLGERELGRLIVIGAFDGKGRWCATVRSAQRFIDLHNKNAGSLKKAMRLKWEPTHYMELTAPHGALSTASEAKNNQQPNCCTHCNDTKEIQLPDNEFLSPCPECAPTTEAGK